MLISTHKEIPEITNILETYKCLNLIIFESKISVIGFYKETGYWKKEIKEALSLLT